VQWLAQRTPPVGRRVLYFPLDFRPTFWMTFCARHCPIIQSRAEYYDQLAVSKQLEQQLVFVIYNYSII